MNATSHETWNTRFRKKVKAISALVTSTGVVIFRPHPGTQYVLESAYARVRKITGTVTDAPNIKLTNGTTDTVAAVDITVPALGVQRLAVVGNVVVDYDHPLTLVSADAADGATVFTYDLILFVDKLSD